MGAKLYFSPVFMVAGGGSKSVTGEGTGQGTNYPEGLSYEDWLEEIAADGNNPDADYDGNGTVDQSDWEYYNENHLWDP